MQIECFTSILRLSLYGAFARKLQRNLRPLARMHHLDTLYGCYTHHQKEEKNMA